MSHKRRFVFDTNVLVSALLFPGSTPERAFRTAFEVGVILASEETLDELAAVLERAKFDPYVAPAERAFFLARFVMAAQLVTITTRRAVSRDPKDDQFLDLALAGGADYLVTGDRKHLLSLGSYEGIRIVTARQFLDDWSA